MTKQAKRAPDDYDKVINSPPTKKAKQKKLCTSDGCSELYFGNVDEKEYCMSHFNMYSSIVKNKPALTLSVSPGKHGLTLKIDKELGGATIVEIDPQCCTFFQQVEVGDRILTVDDILITKVSDFNINSDKTREFGIVKMTKKKKKKKKNSGNCSSEGCTNKASRRGLCAKHAGTTVKSCSVEGCTNQRVKGGVCKRHGAKFECSVVDCSKRVQKDGLCKAHGGKYECSVPDCTNHVIRGGLCGRHGAKRDCAVDGCTNQAFCGRLCGKHATKCHQAISCSADGCTNQVINSGVCVRHGAKRKLCRIDDCSNVSVKGGVCIRHGARPNVVNKRCGVDDCPNIAVQRGVCIRHGATKKRCSFDGCTSAAKQGGVCIKHGAKVKLCSVDGCSKNALRRGLCWGHGAKISSPTATSATTETVGVQDGESWGGSEQNEVGHGNDNDLEEKRESRPSTKEIEMESEIQALKAKLLEMEAKLAAVDSSKTASTLV